MKFHLIRDSTKKEMIFEKIFKNINTAKQFLKINRVDMFYVNIYFQISENETIYFRIFKPSKYGIETLKKEKENENDI